MGRASRRKWERNSQKPNLENRVKDSREKIEGLPISKSGFKIEKHDICSLITNVCVVGSLYLVLESVKQSHNIEKFWDSSSIEFAGRVVFSYGFIHMTYSLAKLAIGLFKSRMQDFEKSGFYGITRHPIYLDHRIMSAGAFLIRPTTKTLAASVVVHMATEIAARMEERQLEKRFGDGYAEYKNQVPRWVPNYISSRSNQLGIYLLKYSPFR